VTDGAGAVRPEQPGAMSDAVRDNAFLFAIVASGAVILAIGLSSPGSEMMQALGAAFIIAGSVGIYMMLATRQVARKLHERFNEQNDILNSHTDILREIVSSQKEMTATQKEIVSSQKEIVSSQKEMTATQKEMAATLRRIEDKMRPQ